MHCVKYDNPKKPNKMISTLNFNKSIKAKQNGFTIVELMVTIAIAGVLVGLAIPSMKAVIDNQRISAANTELISTLIYARSEAVRQKKHITVCASTDGINCNTGSTGIANWSNGWIVFANSSSSNLTRNVSTESLIRVSAAPSGISSITLTLSTGSVSLLSYRPNGSIGNVATNQDKLFTVCDSRGASGAAGTLINRTGRPKSQKTGFSGAALSC